MDKEVLTGYGWIVVCALILAVMIAMVTPFGGFITRATKDTVDGILSTRNREVAPVVIPPGKVYTLEEIEADDRMFAIGETKSEGVLAKFNDDYTAVAIFPNGEESDGIVSEYAPWVHGGATSPLAAYSDSLQQVVFKEGIIRIEGGGAGHRLFGTNPSITSVSLPSSLTYIGDYTFYNCSELEEIIIPKHVAGIGHSVFEGSGLTNITIPDSVKEIGFNSFQDCKSLKSVKLPCELEISGYLFDGCSSLRTVQMPETTKTIEDYAFRGCKALSKITIPDSVEEIENSAFENTGLVSFDLPSNLSSLGAKVFKNCRSLKTVNIPSNTKLNNIPESAFEGSSIDIIEIPSNIKTIKKRAFANSSISNVVVESGLQKIESEAFMNAGALRTMMFPATLTTIDSTAFNGASVAGEIANAEFYCETEDVKSKLEGIVPVKVDLIVDSSKF